MLASGQVPAIFPMTPPHYMNIYIDESGSFVEADSFGAWNSVVAYATPDPDEKKLGFILNNLKQECKSKFESEVKLKNIEENLYFAFLQYLGELEGVLFCTATDAGCNGVDDVKKHQVWQAESVLEYIGKMKYEGGRRSLRYLSEQLQRIPPQLYAQLSCQVDLIFATISRMIPYFAQRNPSALGSFKWRIDQKNISKIDFEDAFEKITPALIQTRSFREPIIMVNEFDYSALAPYMFEPGQPAYLKEEYGLEVDSGLNVQKIFRGNLKFVDSKISMGIQIADLLASGMRRCLRGKFVQNNKAAFMLGRLMIQAQHNKPPLNLIGFSERAIKEKYAVDHCCPK